jgi:hypothetical protein
VRCVWPPPRTQAALGLLDEDDNNGVRRLAAGAIDHAGLRLALEEVQPARTPPASAPMLAPCRGAGRNDDGSGNARPRWR